MSPSALSIPITLNPTLDVPSLNVMIRALKDALGAFGKDIKLIDAQKLNEDLRAVNGAVNQVANGLKTVENNANGAVEKAFKFNQIAQAVTQVAGALQGVLAVGNEYEATLAAVGAVTGQSGEGLDKLGQGARDLAKEFGGSASDNLKSYQGILSKLGPKVAENADALKSMGSTVNLLSAASGDDAATSMNALVDTMLQLGLNTGDAEKDAKKMVQISDALAVSAKVGAAEIPQVAQSMLQVGVAAKGANLGLEGTVAAIQVLSVGGKTGSEAGVALRNVLGLIQKASGPAEAAMQKMGTSSKQLGEILTKQGLGATLEVLKKGMDGLGSAAERNATLMTIFGTENSAAAGILLDNSKLLDQYKTSIEEGVKAGAAGADGTVAQANARLGTAEAITKRIKAQVEDVYIGITQTFGSGISAALTATTQLAPTITSLAGLKNIIPDEAIGKVKEFAVNILKLVPGLFGQAAAQTAVAGSSVAATAGMTATTASTTAAGVAAEGTGASFGAMWLSVLGPIVLVVVAIAAIGFALYELYQHVEGFRNAVDGALSWISAAWEELQPLFEKIIPVLQSIGGFILTYITLPWTIAYEVIKSVIEAFAGTGDAAETSSGSIRAIAQVVSFLSNALNGVIATFDGFKAALQSLSGSVGAVISAILKGDFTGAISALKDAGNKGMQAFQEGLTTSYQNSTAEDLKKRLAKDLEGGITIQTKLESTGDFTALIDQYEQANQKIAELKNKQSTGVDLTKDERESLEKLQAEAETMAQKIGASAPAAKEGLKVIRDESGNLKETFTINTQAARQFTEAQRQAYAGDLKQSQQDMSNNLLKQSAIYQEQEKKLKQVAEAAQNAAKAGKSDEARKLIADYEKLKKSVEEKGQALVQNFNDAGKAGMLTDTAIKEVGKTLGQTGDEAKKGLLSLALADASKNGKLTDTEIAKIASRFGKSTDEAKKLYTEQQKQTDEAGNTAQKVAEIGDAFAQATKDAEENTKKALGDANNTALELRVAEAKAKKTHDYADVERLKKKLAAEIEAAKNSNDQKKGLDAIAEDNAVKAGVREAKRTTSKKKEVESEFALIKKRDEAGGKQLNTELELQKLQEVVSGQRREDSETELYYEKIKLDAYENNLQILRERFKLKPEDNFTIDNIDAKMFKDNEREQVVEFINNINFELLNQQNKVNKLEIKTGLDAEKLREDIRKEFLADLEQKVSIKVEKPDVLIDEYQKDIDELFIKMSKAQANGDAALQREIKGKIKSLNDSIKKVRDESYKEQVADLENANKKRKEQLEQQLKDQQLFSNRMNQIIQDSGTRAIDKSAQDQLKHLDDLKEQELITEKEYNASKQELETIAAQQKEALQNVIRGRELEAERQHSIALLEEDKKRLEDRRAIAIKNKDDATAQKLTEELDAVTSTLEQKKDVFSALGEDFKAAASEFVGGMFEADWDRMKAPMKKLFGIISGFLQKLASAKIMELLLNSEASKIGGITGLAIMYLLKPALETGVGVVLNPILASLTSFGTGGIVEKPTFAQVGDRAGASTGDMTEYILGSDQLGLIISEVLRPVIHEFREGFAQVTAEIRDLQFRLSVSGNDLVTATDRTRTANMRRARMPYGNLSTT